MRSTVMLAAIFAVTAAAQTTINIPGASRPSSSDISISENAAKREVTCEKNNVFVSGNKNEVTIKGICRNVHITGSGNTVLVEDRSDRIVAEGSDNTVNYRWPNTGVSNTGTGNHVAVVK